MNDKVLGSRQKALEESFFHQEAQRVIEKMRLEKSRMSQLQEMEKVSGVTDRALLVKIMNLGIDAKTFWALTLTPLVEVAWSDGSIDSKERSAILQAAESSGVMEGSAMFSLLESWLEKKPEPKLIEAWIAYVQTLCGVLSEEERARLKAKVLGTAQEIAEATGGILGLGSKISASEQKVLDRLSGAFPS